MAKRTVTDNCHLCQTYTKMTYEHVPPEAAFNDERIVKQTLEQMLEQKGKRTWEQRGAGAYTLCSSCNSNTGGWYGGAYVRWAHQAGRMVLRGRRAYPHQVTFTDMYPLRVVKQIAVMFASATNGWLTRQNPDFSRWLLNREDHGFPHSEIAIYMALTTPETVLARQSGIMATLNFGGSSNLFSEISFPPFVFVLAADGTPPDNRLICINSFAQYGYQDKTTLSFPSSQLDIASSVVGDYRTHREVGQNAMHHSLLGGSFATRGRPG